MPPQQPDRPLDVFNEALGFGAHGFVPSAHHLATIPAVRNSVAALAAS
jgi:hypothetical protein